MGLSDLEDLHAIDPLDALAEEFADRCRRGEQPEIEDYVATHPDLAESIRKLFPTVAFLERGRGERTRSNSGLSSGGRGPSGELPLRQIGENRILRELGRGGMGIVYEAEQESLGRRVAVKVLPGHAAFDEKSRRRFVREAKAVARLQHPNIVPIYSVGEEVGIPYYVMALVDGTSLDRLLAEDVPDDPAGHPRWVAQLGLQAAEALAFAHKQGILHRDIKPSNLLLDHAGTLWLGDFGLAKLADDLSLTGSGELPGTLRYLAPECLHVDGDERSDIYSLGLTLYEILLGQPAFTETNRARLLKQVQDHTPAPPRASNPAIPRDLETIILKAMQREPNARYASATEMAADLDRFLIGEAIQARPISLAERFVRAIRRNPTVAFLTGTSVILALIAAYFVRLYLMAPPPPRRFNGPPQRPMPPPDRGRPNFPPPPHRPDNRPD